MNPEGSKLLQLYEQLSTIKGTWRKKILLLKNKNTGQYSIAKIQIRAQESKSIQQGPIDKTVRHQGKFLLQMQGHIGIPLMRWVGKDGIYDVLIVEKLGKTFQQLLTDCQGKFSIKTVCMLGIRLIKILQTYHEKYFIHKCICPWGFQTGIGVKNTQFYFNDLIDSQTYFNKTTFKHVQNKKNIRLIQATPFMTYEQLAGEQCSRRSDIQSLIIMLIYFLKGSLPWIKVGENEENVDKKRIYLMQEILKYTPEKICQGLPVQFKQMLIKCRNTQFAEQPDYYYFMKRFKQLLFRKNWIDDQIYDWIIKKNSQTGQLVQLYRLKLSKCLPNLQSNWVKRQKQILQQFYYPNAEKVNIDQITEKYIQMKNRQKELESSDLYENDPSEPPKHRRTAHNIPNSQTIIDPRQAHSKKDNCEIF